MIRSPNWVIVQKINSSGGTTHYITLTNTHDGGYGIIEANYTRNFVK